MINFKDIIEILEASGNVTLPRYGVTFTSEPNGTVSEETKKQISKYAGPRQ